MSASAGGRQPWTGAPASARWPCRTPRTPHGGGCFLSLCPRRWYGFASSPWPLERAYGLEAMDTTRGYVRQRGSKEERQ